MSTGVEESNEIAYILVDVSIIQGRKLAAMDIDCLTRKKRSDPYVVINYNGKSYGRTKTQYKTTSPKWNHNFEMIMGTVDAHHAIQGHTGYNNLSLRIFDKDKASADDFMGEAIIALPATTNFVRPQTSWYPIGTGTGDSNFPSATGEIQVKLSLSPKNMVETVRGNTCPIPNDSSVVLQWQVTDGQKIDLNLSSVAIDSYRNMVLAETVGFGKNANPNDSIRHSGDIAEGELSKLIDCNLNSVPMSVSELYFIVTVPTPDKTLDDAKAVSVRLIDKGESTGSSVTSNMTLCAFTPSRGEEHTAMYLMRFARDLDNWNMTIIDGMSSGRGPEISQIKALSLSLNEA